MNTANLQLEGMLIALASLVGALKQKGLLSQEDIEEALTNADAATDADAETRTELRPAHFDAIRFPLRFLRLANDLPPDQSLSFAKIATMIGETKPDQPRGS